jgi:ribosomal protein S12 methylthiotransferase accessory factor
MTAAPRYPIPAGPLILRGHKATAFLPREVVKLRFNGVPAAAFLEYCDGATPYASIRARLARHVHTRTLDAFAKRLVQAGVLIDSSEITRRAWAYAENPPALQRANDAPAAERLPPQARRRARPRVRGQYYRPAAFSLRSTMEKRRSVRAFADVALPLKKIVALLWSTNGWLAGRTARRVVASAGALYPLHVGFINLRSTRRLARGIYRIHFRADGCVGLRRVAGDTSAAARAFVDPAPLANAQGVICVFGDFDLNASKYGNRSVLFVTLEAGHAAHSAMLAAAELGAGTLEVGGFYEDRLARLFGLRRPRALSAIAIGKPGPARPAKEEQRFDFRWVDFSASPYQPPFHVGMVDLSDDKSTLLCWGRSRDSVVAWRKALAEARERLACTAPHDLYEATFAQARAAVDPRTLVCYSEAQYRRRGFPFQPFSERERYFWQDGTDLLTGKPRAVLADCAYFPDDLPVAARRRLFTSANSSGVAAHSSWEYAITRAILELLERHAFMRAWLAGETGQTIRPSSLPASFRARIARLRALDIKLVVKLLSRDPVPVFMVFAQNAARPFTSVSAAAATRPEEGLDHALGGAEAFVAVRLMVGPPPAVTPQQVRVPGHHASLYSQRAYFRRADHLARDSAAVDMPRTRRRHCSDLSLLENWARESSYRPVWLPLGARESGPVVRAFVPGLLPLTFGYGREPLGLLPQAPRAALFPHPFS